MKVTAILKGMIDQNGHQPIQIIVAHGATRKFFPTHIKVEPKLFDKGRILPAHPKAKELNKIIEIKIIQYQAKALEGFDKKIPKTDLIDYIKKTCLHLTREYSTVRVYQSQLNKLRRFRPSIYLTDINHDFFNGYKAHLKAIGNDNNTIWSSFKFLKTFIKKAINEGLLKENPFLNWEAPGYIETNKKYLTEDEIKLFDKFAKGNIAPDLKQTAYWFLIGCYTGLRISDIKAFDKKKHIVGGRLIVVTQKTGEIISLPISDKLRKYFEAVDYQPPTIHENTYNKLLKVIASAIGIEKTVHAHLSRHSFAMMLANLQISQEVAAKLLGHSNLKSTSVYYKISNQRIDSEMQKLK